MAGWNTLVQAETLAIAIGRPDLKIVDARFTIVSPGAGESAFLLGHLPGAVYAHLDRDLSDMSRKGAGRHPWPDAATFTRKLGEWGIGPDDQVIVYDDGDGAHAARFWALMRMLGHEKVAVLDGGWQRWTALGLPVDSQPHRPITTRYTAVHDHRIPCLAAGGDDRSGVRAAPRSGRSGRGLRGSAGLPARPGEPQRARDQQHPGAPRPGRAAAHGA